MMTLLGLRYEYGQCVDSAHKQIGLRAIRNAIALGDRNLELVVELRATASFHLPYARAMKVVST